MSRSKFSSRSWRRMIVQKRFRCDAVFMLVLLVSLSLFTANADIKLPTVIGNSMVLQSGRELPIWGMAEPGETVTVSIGDQKASTYANNYGNWIVKLKPLDAGGPFEMTIAGNNTVVLSDILVGEVWVCSGQSNMAMSVKSSNNAEEEIAAADYPKIRLFTVKRTVAAEPQWDVEGKWVMCSPETVGSFSAAGFFFGRDLHEKLGVPVGLINTSWGGTPAESWTRRPTLEAYPEFAPIIERWEQRMADYPKAMEEYPEKVSQWEKEVQEAKAKGETAPRKPGAPMGPDSPYRPGGLYNAMIAPLVPLAIKGAIWYQGEANAGRAYQYRELFSRMIKDWRDAWGQGDFPFIFVQLANFMQILPDPDESAWAELREAQSMALLLPNTATAVAIDIGEGGNIHPKNKQDVGHRLALGALKVAYGRDLVYSGPVYDSANVEGNRVRLSFKYIGDGLMAKDGDELKGFSIAGQDHKFVWAKAEIDGDTIVVWSDDVTAPEAVRYGWANNPICNLYNKAGLPASPFRTDYWRGITVDSQ